MRSRILSLIFTLFICSMSYGQGVWQKVESKNVAAQPSELVEYISEYSAYELNYDEFLNRLSKAPMEFSGEKGMKAMIPMPNGTLQDVNVFRSKIMEDGLAEKYPLIKNYIFTSKEGISGRFAVSPIGFTASVSSPEGKIYIDRYADNNTKHYVSYYIKNYTKDASMLPACGVSSEENEKFVEAFDFENSPIPSTKIKSPEGEVMLRSYRIAIATTGEFSQQKGGDKDDILAILNESVTKLNEIFESEVAIRFVLVADNDKIIHLNPATDPYVNSNQGAQLIGQNTAAIGNIIPLNNWDIGHVFTGGCTDVGGIAALQSVCGPNKGNGVTCHYSNNLDVIITRVAAHEIGHQFGATHTFNHCDGENESTGSGFEPGSGHTIMSYAGGCGAALNVANAPYIYYHGNSLDQMINFSQVGNGNSCPELINTSNTYPQVSHDYGEKLFYIPLETPFQLTGKVDDAEDSNITYSWEEFDLGPLTTPGDPILDAPQFVSEVPNETPRRILPELNKIVTNNYDKLEVLPFYEKDMTWRLTVRDNNSEAGGVDWVETRFIATETAGPFKVLYPNQPENLVAGTLDTIKWDVANSDNDIVNCKHVNIYLSDNAGSDFAYKLAENTENDGEAAVYIPSVDGNFVRVWIEAADNIFFDISDQNSKILEATEAGFSATAFPSYQELCLPNNAEVEIATEQFLGFDEEITLEVISGAPNGATLEFTNNPLMPGESTSLMIDATSVMESSEYEIVIKASSASKEIEFSTKLDIISSDFSDLAIISPAKGESGVGILPTFTWVEDKDAQSYTFELSNNPDFETGTILVKLTDLTEETITLDQPIDRNSVYFWRVTGLNSCGFSSTTAISTFAAESLTCKDYTENEVPVSLPSSGTPTTILESVVVANGEVSDINVSLLKGTHTRVKDLRVSLRSPSGKTAILFDKRCAGSTAFNVAFDTDSPTEIQCPMLNAKKYKPEESLEIFNGEQLQGTWELVIEDLISGNGGKVTDYTLNICSNVNLGEAPVLDKNNPLKIVPGAAELINQGRLRVTDGDNDDDELTYTLVEIPSKGELRKNGNAMKVGDTYTQDDLNNNYISYKHTDSSTEPAEDSFIFVVDDSEGGWIDQTVFGIGVDLLNDVNENSFDYEVEIFPNPTSGEFTIELPSNSDNDINVEIVNFLGQVITSQNKVNGNQMVFDLTNNAKGTYFVKVTIDGKQKVFNVSVQ